MVFEDVLPFLNFPDAGWTALFSSIILGLIFYEKKKKFGITDDKLLLPVGLILLSLALFIFGTFVGNLINYSLNFFFTGNLSNYLSNYSLIIPQIFLTIFFAFMRSELKKPLILHKDKVAHKLGKVLGITSLILVITLPFFISSIIFNQLYRTYLIEFLEKILSALFVSYLLFSFFGIIDGLFRGVSKWFKILWLETKNTLKPSRNKFLLVSIILISFFLPFLVFPNVSLSENVYRIHFSQYVQPSTNIQGEVFRNYEVETKLIKWVAVPIEDISYGEYSLSYQQSKVTCTSQFYTNSTCTIQNNIALIISNNSFSSFNVTVTGLTQKNTTNNINVSFKNENTIFLQINNSFNVPAYSPFITIQRNDCKLSIQTVSCGNVSQTFFNVTSELVSVSSQSSYCSYWVQYNPIRFLDVNIPKNSSLTVNASC